ncbi:predicted protein [Thalassiosira pseudonana CCMP1335]|uniref:Alpha 1,4-glycosyltransferase domain-containing protein n=1 Tax=Thalassiosira pseudonana TaxID=35128 RepID=B8LCT4_THAPS|nr:predicted protein [Thalassiosira pseudonana CCMP1335]EED86847.1 predicted protein [Thalassiosira pseudonana CCMP1335]
MSNPSDHGSRHIRHQKIKWMLLCVVGVWAANIAVLLSLTTATDATTPDTSMPTEFTVANDESIIGCNTYYNTTSWRYYNELIVLNANLAASAREATGVDISMSHESSSIPHRLIFTHQYNLLECSISTRDPQLNVLAQNAKATIQLYKQVWPDVEVTFLTDEQCIDAIRETHPGLLRWYDLLRGMYKGDLCRAVYLFSHGGYYFDIDLLVVKPVVISDDVLFATVKGVDFPSMGFFQAFIAAAPRNRIVAKSIELMGLKLKEKRGNLANDEHLGPMALMQAWLQEYNVTDPTSRNMNHEVWLLTEKYLEEVQSIQPSIPLQVIPTGHGGKSLFRGGACNFFVVDEIDDSVYFYSRVLGTAWCGMRNPLSPWPEKKMMKRITRKCSLSHHNTSSDGWTQYNTLARENMNTTILTYHATQRVEQNNHMMMPSSNESPRIPHRLVFIHQLDLLDCSVSTMDPHLHNLAENVKATIGHYKTEWQDIEVEFLNDAKCQEVISKSFPDFQGTHAELCRAAYLYSLGGYYIDVELLMVMPVILPNNVEFATIKGDEFPDNGFFPGFLASAPKNSVVGRSIDIMKQELHANGKLRNENSRVSTSLMEAWITQYNIADPKLWSTSDEANDNVRLLKEMRLSEVQSKYGTLPKQADGFTERPNFRGDLCNFVVADDDEIGLIRFYSRMLGGNGCGYSNGD